jgi:DNA-binding transcriptional LysR family regulator
MGDNCSVMIDDLLQRGGLSLDRLQNFCRVAEARGVTKAAKGDPARQSLFSRQIKELEEFFGVELMRRSGRGVTLTKAGRRLHEITREQLLGLQDFKHACLEERIPITLAAGESIIQWLVIPKLPGLLPELPNVTLRVLNLSSSEIATGLADGTLDLGIIRAGAEGGRIQTAPLGPLHFSLFVPSRFVPEKCADGFSHEIMAKLPMATLEGEGVFRSQFDSLLRRKARRLNIQVELSSFPLIAQTVDAGICAAVLPSLACREFNTGGVTEVKPRWLGSLSREMVLAWNPRLARIRPVLLKAISVCKAACRLG